MMFLCLLLNIGFVLSILKKKLYKTKNDCMLNLHWNIQSSENHTKLLLPKIFVKGRDATFQDVYSVSVLLLSNFRHYT